MASGSFSLNKTLGVSAYIYSRCEWSSSTDITNNRSTININVIVGKRTGSNTPTTCNFNTSVTVSGANSPATQTSGPYASVSGGQEINVFSKSFTIDHNADGTKSTTISASIGNNDIYHANGSANVTLDTIPRTSKPSFPSSGTLGSNLTFNTNRASNNFTHTLIVCRGTTKYQTISNQGATISWTPTLDTYASLITGNPPSGNFQLICETYNGSNKIGQESSTISLTVPNNSSTKPTASLTVEEANSVVKSKGINFFVEGLSKLKGTISTTTKYGATIKSYSASIFGSSYSTQQFTTNVLPYAGYTTVDVSVKDSRGFTAYASKDIEITSYFNPSVYNIEVNRCLDDGTISREGTHVSVSCTAKVAYLQGKNFPTLKVQYNEQGNEANKIDITFNNQPTRKEYSGSGIFLEYTSEPVPATTFDIDRVYNFTFTVSDLFNTSSANEILTTAFDIINISESGKRVAFGKLAPPKANDAEADERFDIAMPAYYNERPMLSYKGSSNLLVHQYTKSKPLTSMADKNAPMPVEYCCYLEANKWYTMSYKSDNESYVGRYSSMWLIDETWNYAYYTSLSSWKAFKPAVSGLYYLCGHHSGSASIPMYDFKVERGKFPTPYDTPKNPKIYASLGDDNEQIIADLGNSVLNWRTIWKGELLGGYTINMDFSKYKRLKIHFNCYSCTGSFELDLEKIPEIIYNDTCLYMASGVSGYGHADAFEYHTCQVGIASDMQKLYHHRIGYTFAGEWRERNSNGNYYIYKVEGILKE